MPYFIIYPAFNKNKFTEKLKLVDSLKFSLPKILKQMRGLQIFASEKNIFECFNRQSLHGREIIDMNFSL